VNFGRVYCDFLVYIFYSSIFWDTRRWIKSKSTIRSIRVKWLAVMIYIWEVLGSVLSPEASYPDLAVLWFCTFSSECCNNTLM